jgi:hypothetical protein
MFATRPATRAALTLFEFLLGSTNPPLASYVLFGVFDPTDELVSGERRDVLPRVECRSVADQSGAQIRWQFVDHAARYPLSAHDKTLSGTDVRVACVLAMSQFL